MQRRQQPQRAVGALSAVHRVIAAPCATPAAYARRLIRRRGPRHRLSHVHLNAPLLIAHRPGTGHGREPPAQGPTPLIPARHDRQPSDPPTDGKLPARRSVRSLEVIYCDLAPPASALAARYQAAAPIAARRTCPWMRPRRTCITLSTTPVIPRPISLAVAANALHFLPAAVLDAAIGNDVLGTLDLTAAGSLHRCHQALEAHAQAQGYDADEWLPLAYAQAADWLEHASAAADPPALIDHAQQAGRYAAVAIGSLDRNAPNAPEAITNRHPRPPPHRMRVRRHRPHQPVGQVTRFPTAVRTWRKDRSRLTHGLREIDRALAATELRLERIVSFSDCLAPVGHGKQSPARRRTERSENETIRSRRSELGVVSPRSISRSPCVSRDLSLRRVRTAVGNRVTCPTGWWGRCRRTRIR